MLNKKKKKTYKNVYDENVWKTNGTLFLSSSQPRQQRRQTFQNPHSLRSFNARFIRLPTNFGLLFVWFQHTIKVIATTFVSLL